MESLGWKLRVDYGEDGEDGSVWMNGADVVEFSFSQMNEDTEYMVFDSEEQAIGYINSIVLTFGAKRYNDSI